jgi:hypothetical protein
VTVVTGDGSHRKRCCRPQRSLLLDAGKDTEDQDAHKDAEND